MEELDFKKMLQNDGRETTIQAYEFMEINDESTDMTMTRGTRLPQMMLKLLEEEGPHSVIYPDGTFLLYVKDTTKLVNMGYYSSDTFPFLIFGWLFESNKKPILTPFNIKEKRNVDVFLALPEDDKKFVIVYVDNEGVVKHFDGGNMSIMIARKIQEIWNDSSLDWSEYDCDYTTLVELSRNLVEEGMEWSNLVHKK